jgi:hypothetical protein
VGRLPSSGGLQQLDLELGSEDADTIAVIFCHQALKVRTPELTPNCRHPDCCEGKVKQCHDFLMPATGLPYESSRCRRTRMHGHWHTESSCSNPKVPSPLLVWLALARREAK